MGKEVAEEEKKSKKEKKKVSRTIIIISDRFHPETTQVKTMNEVKRSVVADLCPYLKITLQMRARERSHRRKSQKSIEIVLLRRKSQKKTVKSRRSSITAEIIEVMRQDTRVEVLPDDYNDEHNAQRK